MVEKHKKDNKIINLVLPDWVHPDANIFIFAGIESVARFRPGLSSLGWEVKVKRCSECGYCCTQVNSNHTMGRNPLTNSCRHLTQYSGGNICGLLASRPFLCCAADNSGGKKCTIKWESVDGGN